MVTKEAIMELVKGQLLNRVLLIAEACLPESQFRAFRKLILDEFGQSGLGKELERIFRGSEQEKRKG